MERADSGFVTPAAPSSISRTQSILGARGSRTTPRGRRGSSVQDLGRRFGRHRLRQTGAGHFDLHRAGAGAIGLDLQLERDRLARPDFGHRLEADLPRETRGQ